MGVTMYPRWPRVFLSALLLTGGLFFKGRPARSQDAGASSDSGFEYIVVGSGAGGGPLAANLARAGFRVLLLEAGGYTGGNLTYDIPALSAQATEDPSLAWGFFVDHYNDRARQERDSKIQPQGILYPRGATLGGSTAVNAMVTVYPHESDWDHIADLTQDESWRPESMRRYFERVERNQYLGFGAPRQGHGFEGWLAVEQVNGALALGDRSLTNAVFSAATVAGGSFLGAFGQLVSLSNADLNADGPARDARQGLFTVPNATNEGRRNGTREYLLDTVALGYPLTIRTHALVTRVLFDESAPSPIAVGVEYLEGAHLYGASLTPSQAEGVQKEVSASREVILAAGAFNTPQLLLLSGIGPRFHLRKMGIPLRVNLPGVGANLQDRYEVGIVARANNEFTSIRDCSFDPEVEDRCLREWKDGGGGPYASGGVSFGFIHKSRQADGDPDLFIFGVPGFFKGYEPGYSKKITADRSLFTWLVLKAHTRNRRGKVRLRSTNPQDPPAINFRYFDDGNTKNGEDEDDLAAVVEGVDKVREIIARSDGYTEIWPGPHVSSRFAIEQFVKDEAWGHHASCSARIGRDNDPLAVLDSRFRVRGVQKLRVVDASVFPKIPGFFVVVPVFMISEKATDVIIADAHARRPD